MMDPCVTSYGLTLKVRAIPGLAVPLACGDWVKQVYEGRRVRPGKKRARLVHTGFCLPPA